MTPFFEIVVRPGEKGHAAYPANKGSAGPAAGVYPVPRGLE